MRRPSWSLVTTAVAALFLIFYEDFSQLQTHNPIHQRELRAERRLLMQRRLRDLRQLRQFVAKWNPEGFALFNRTNGNYTLPPFDSFHPRQCNRTNLDGEWYPKERHSLARRMPAFIIAGAPKSGTSCLFSWLVQHNHAVSARKKEAHYFRDFPLEQDGTLSVKEARDMATEFWPVEKLESHRHQFAFEATPNYLYRSSFVMGPAFCIAPWLKVIVVLRDPIERAFAEYRYNVQRLGKQSSFEEVIHEELYIMNVAGLLDENLVPGSKEEKDAWHLYHSVSNTAYLGKGMYDIQLRYMMEAMKQFGKSPKEDLLILELTDLSDDPHTTYDKILRFLHLDAQEMPEIYEINQGQFHEEMDEITRHELEVLYAPGQMRLAELMGDGWELHKVAEQE